MVSGGRKPAWILTLRDGKFVLYRHFYRRKASALAAAGMATNTPARPGAPMTSLGFVLAGAALGLLQLSDSKHHRLAQWGAALLLIALVACEIVVM
jgi:hypothetical protein